MDDQKICFVTCVNDDREYEECLLYIRHLQIPEGIEIELMAVKDAVSMAAGYREGMMASNAKYKVYLHQDVRIVNLNFIKDILSIFRYNKNVGMIGMVGSPVLPADGVMWHGGRVGDSVGSSDSIGEYDVLRDGYVSVEAIDGFLMATQYDLPWREDLFDGWDFYDISQSQEFIIKGYQVVVPRMSAGWCVHEEKSSLSLWNYNHYRRIFLENYIRN